MPKLHDMPKTIDDMRDVAYIYYEGITGFNPNDEERLERERASNNPYADHYFIDAFRHTFSFAYISYEFASTLAYLAGQGHEWLSQTPLSDHRMDIWNNAVGRRIGEQYYAMYQEAIEGGNVFDTQDFEDTLLVNMARQIVHNMDGTGSTIPWYIIR